MKPFNEAGIETVCKQLLERLNKSERYYFQVAISSGISAQVLGGERFVQSYAYELAIYFKPIYIYGRPNLTWAEGIRGLMGEKVLMEEDWNDRGNWRKKIL